MRIPRSTVLLGLILATVSSGALAQTPPPTETSAAPIQAPTAGQPPRRARLSWTSDRRPVRVGDILTVIIDEEASAREQTGKSASAKRGTDMSLGAGIPDAIRLGPAYEFSTGLGSSSRDAGEENRSGDLYAVLSVRVTEIEPTGAARIVGTKQVEVDGRAQQFTLSGVVRPQDITAANTVLSSRIAEAEIGYKGDKIKPRSGILSKILSIFWP